MSSGRKRTTDRHYSAEEQALDQISKEAEERIQARRQARAEAREIRLKEIERQQKEEEEKQKAQQQGIDTSKSASSYSGSRRGSNDSTESDVSSKDSKDPKDQVRNLKNQLRELEEKYKAAMVTNAQLDNVKTSNVFQVELLKEQLEEQEEAMIEVQREYKDKCRDFELLKRDYEALKLEHEGIKRQIELKDKLLKESGLIVVTTDEGQFSLTKCSNLEDVPVPELGTAIISEEAADLLKKAGEGTLGKPDSDVRVISLESLEAEVAAPDGYRKDVGSDVKVSDEKIDIDKCVNEIVVTENLNLEGTVKLFSQSEEIKDTELEVSSKSENENERGDSVQKDVDGRMREEKRESVSDSDNEVFYESKSDFSPVDAEGVTSNAESVSKVESASDKECVLEEERSVVEKESENDSDKSVVEECVGDDGNKIIVETQAENDSNKSSIRISVGDTGIDGTDVEKVERRIKPEYPTRKTGNLSLDVRRLLGSESCISMESDVTYHSESEDLDLFEDTIIDHSTDYFLSSQAVEEKSGVVSAVDVSLDNSVSDEAGFDDFHGFRIQQDVDFSQISQDSVAQSIVEDNSQEERDKIGGDLPTENVAAFLSDVDIKNDARDKANAGSQDDAQISGFPSGTQFDEVFMSLPFPDMGDKNMREFARNYVKDVIMKSVERYNMELVEDKDKITVRRESYAKASVDISVAKQHYSEELMDVASSVFPKRLSSGSVEILSPITNIPSDGKGDLKFFSYKVDTGADVVLTSIEEEKEIPKESLFSLNALQSGSVHSPVSGFGIYYSGVASHSDLDSDENNEGSDVDNEAVIADDSEMKIEFSPMPVGLESKLEGEADVTVESTVNGTTNGGDVPVVTAQEDGNRTDGIGHEDSNLIEVEGLDESNKEDMSSETVTANVEQEVNEEEDKPVNNSELCSVEQTVNETESDKDVDKDTGNIVDNLAGSDSVDVGKIQANGAKRERQAEVSKEETGLSKEENIKAEDSKSLETDDVVENNDNLKEESCTQGGASTVGVEEKAGSRVSASSSVGDGGSQNAESDSLERKKAKKKSTKLKTKDEKKPPKEEKRSSKEEKKNQKEKEECIVS